MIGTGKEDAIAGNALLSLYREQFQGHLLAGQTRIMVIGYSFADGHINELLLEGARNAGLTMYLVNPAGLDIFNGYKGQSGRGAELLQIPLVGLWTRPLSATFGDADDPSFESFYRFFEGASAS